MIFSLRHASFEGGARLSGEKAECNRLIPSFFAAVTGTSLVPCCSTESGCTANGSGNPNFGTIHLTDRRRISLFETTTLVPIGIGGRLVTRGIQFGKLSRGEVPAYGTQILA
jgi:hypothetical protein